MDAAIIGLIGVVVGAAILTVRDYFLAAKKEATDKKRKRAEKFEELVAAVVEHYEWMGLLRFFAISGQGSMPTLSPIAKIEAIASTYFPEFEVLVGEFNSVSNHYEMWILDTGQKRLANELGHEKLLGHHEVLKNYTDKRVEFLTALRLFARREFQ
jgi:hypothetical protein